MQDIEALQVHCAIDLALARSRHGCGCGKRVGCGVQQYCNRLQDLPENVTVVQGEAALSNGRHVLQFSNNLRTAHSPVPAPAATVNEAISKTSGRRKLAGDGPGPRIYSDQANGRRLAGEGPGPRIYSDQGTGRRLAGEGPGARTYNDQGTTGRRLAGEGPGARTYNDQGATQGVNVVRPVGNVACCAQAGYGCWRGAKPSRDGASCSGNCPIAQKAFPDSRQLRAHCDCVWQSAEGCSIVQGRKLKGATAGEPVSGGPADPVVRGCHCCTWLHNACCHKSSGC